ncbi:MULTISPECIES: DNA-binding domain-containing protein [unclassified Sedimentibacter]|uniref:DNA-binding domain-containing protein n=1 Tax=unclassified Sedimentibacter TaxID=2649220 RepID=UPI0027DEDD9A|nr:DNA-binding domain-containing protein [Sedimentibacter sp. MB35-C1]WMJ78752.1 DNA-binding domain-containing protein [Sedimentibacter sp. MB35-C1]
MRIYIIDDDITVVKMLGNIIEDNDLGIVCGYALDGNKGLSEITALEPDIVLADLLMPEKDGISLAKEFKDKSERPAFIMISQVSSKSMISKAYSEGIDFFINKPINVIEVSNVIRNIVEKINYKKTLNNIQSLIYKDGSSNAVKIPADTRIKKIQLILNRLGMTGEKGEKEILAICNYLIVNDKTMSDLNIKDLCKILSPNSKNMEQRIRRAVSKGLTNIAYLGIEDYMNDIFIMYSNSLFNFEDVKTQMDMIRGKNKFGGKINIKKFIDGLLINS